MLVGAELKSPKIFIWAWASVNDEASYAWMGQVALGLQTDLFPHINFNFMCSLIGSRVSIRL